MVQSVKHQQLIKSKDMGVSKIRGTPKWMVYNRKPHSIKVDDFGVPPF